MWALLTTAVSTTAANRRFTFGVVGPRRLLRHHAQRLAIFAGGLAATSGALFLSHTFGPSSRGLEVAVLAAANLGVTVARFAAMRLRVFRPQQPAVGQSGWRSPLVQRRQDPRKGRRQDHQQLVASDAAGVAHPLHDDILGVRRPTVDEQAHGRGVDEPQRD